MPDEHDEPSNKVFPRRRPCWYSESEARCQWHL